MCIPTDENAEGRKAYHRQQSVDGDIGRAWRLPCNGEPNGYLKYQKDVPAALCPQAPGCLILGGGEIADYSAVGALLKGDEFILCADSGLLHCEGLGVRPDLLVGDFDSAGVLPRGVEIMAYPAEKDYTDSALAVREALRRGYRRVLMAGMLGRRFDHTLGNLQNLAWCATNGMEARITDGRTDIFAVKDGTVRLEPRGNAYFSVFPLVTECGGVTIKGAKYPLDGYPLRCDDPRAVSNEFADGEAEITVTDGMIAVVVTPKEG